MWPRDVNDGAESAQTKGVSTVASVNKVILIGNLGRDPELRQTNSGQSVCEFSMATTDRWFDKNSNEQRERTEWHRIIVWGRQGENVHRYLKKGRAAYVEGRLQTRDWQDKDGNKRYTTEVIAQTVQFLGGRDGGGGGYDGPPPPSDDDAPQFSGGNDNGGSFSDDEIPF